jgi:hypothetical protein
VDVVTNAGTVGSRVVVTKDLKALRELTNRHLSQKGEKVSGPSPRVLTDQTAGVRTGRVEVTETDGAPLLGSRVGDVLDDQLGHELGTAVDGFGWERGGLGDGDGGGGAVNGGGGGVDDVVDRVAIHDLLQEEGG